MSTRFIPGVFFLLLIGPFLPASPWSALAQQLSQEEARIVRYLETHQEEAIALAAGNEDVSLRTRIGTRAALGDIDGAIQLLEQAFRERSPWLPQVAASKSPIYADLQTDPQWQVLRRRMGLE